MSRRTRASLLIAHTHVLTTRLSLSGLVAGVAVALCFMQSLGACADGVVDRPDVSVLNLQEEEVISLPAEHESHGIAVSDASILSWGGEARLYVRRNASTGWEIVPTTSPAPLSVAFDELGAIWILDSLARASVRLATPSAGTRSESLALPSNFDAAAVLQGVWLVSTNNADSTSSVVRLLPSGPDTVLTVPPTSNGQRTIPSRLLVSRVSRSWVLVDRFYPFTVRILDPDGQVIKSETPGLETAGQLPTSELDKLVAIAIVAIDSSFLLTLGELTSARRALVTLDALGKVKRYRELDVPIAFVASNERHVIAMRRLTGTQTLVRYRWQWVAGEQ